ncbi:hypothetical protein BU25DRAFT_406127 [Macroventuria anomochaeta]|uniref:Uncharacterized protein n=1 Tax=Macroventuria anomochaeta TaxID=301207 RepID=A0ACB6SH63_9PLEO|nr:uncharacterized protein BU25DRAFT_406127 [Macroventuria anomochaeta]KAF2632817.1 hypothetical protein BU25DRAFT_406127 [Macroventuria anomochaeta]
MFAQTPLRVRAAVRAVAAQTTRTYTSRAAEMPTRTAPIRTLLRTTTLRASTTAAQRASPYLTSQIHTQTQPSLRSRSPSPPPRYEVRNHSLLAAPNQWTRFSTPTSLSSVRTFTSSPKILWPAESPPSISPEHLKVIEDHIETITEMFGTAKDEFEIASEETDKNTTYAQDDREAAREELDKLLEYYGRVVSEAEEAVGAEVKRRVGHRIRELKAGVEALEERALEHD